MRLENKVALITGSASGIGKEIAIIFAREGAKVAIADLNLEAAEATAREIDPSGKRAIGVAMDVTERGPGRCRHRRRSSRPSARSTCW